MPVVAVVGRPNVGKSTLFNYLVGSKRAIVGPERGITRDRIYGQWKIDEGLVVDLVDTGGYDTIAGSGIELSMREQTLQAIDEADVLMCVFDAATGITPDDEELVRLLRSSDANVVYVANKVDDPHGNLGVTQLYELGLGEFIEISALNRRGMDELSAVVKAFIAELPAALPEDLEGAIRVGILGRPNVGKSQLLNTLIGKDRAIVSSVAGTTRDYVDIPLDVGGRKYVFVDTAGVRRKTRIDDDIEKFSVIKSLRNIEMSDVCLVLIDATEGITEQDRRLCRLITDHGRPFVLMINKCDIVDQERRNLVRGQIQHSMRHVQDLNIMFISALTGRNVKKIHPLIISLYDKSMSTISTGELNRVLSRAVEAHNPPMLRGRRIKFFYATQTGTLPPRFRIVTSRPDEISDQYTKYLAGYIKKALGLEGVTIKIHYAGR